MCSPDSSDTGQAAHGALDEFAREDRADTPGNGFHSAGNDTFVFDCESQPPAEIALAGALLEATPALPAHRERRKPLSRLEARAKHRRHGRRLPFRRMAANAAAWADRLAAAWATLATGVTWGPGALRRSVTHLSHRSTQAVTKASRHTMLRVSAIAHDRMRATGHLSPGFMSKGMADGSVMATQESNGFVIAMLLAMTTVGYGSFLVGSWRGAPAPEVSARAIGTRDATAIAPAPNAVAAPVEAPPPVTEARMSPPAVAHTVTTVASRTATFTPSARTLTAMWQRRDTRSLDQAFYGLRRQTLAFHRCGMRVTDVDSAVARCEGVATAMAGGTHASRRTTWTIDFRRTSGRWLISRVAMR